MEVCSYHARAKAPWHCPSCAKFFCRDCHPGGESNFGRSGPRCPLCRNPLNWLGTTSEEPPFWQVSGRFFLYALKPPSLMVMALFVLGSLVLGPTLFGKLVMLLLMLILTRYAMTVIARIAEGNNEPPGLLDMIGGSTSHSLQLLAVLVVFWFAAGFAAAAAPLLGQLVMLLETGILPACVMVLAVTGNVLNAINPMLVFRVIGAIGWSYLVLWLAVSVVTSGPEYLLALLPPRSWAAAMPVIFASVFYFSVVAAAMMGYVLFHRSGELGLQVDRPRGDDLPPEDFLRRTALGFSNIYLQERRLDDALASLREGLAKFPADVALHERMQQLLLREGTDEALARHSNEYLGLLVRNRQAGKAGSAWLDVRRRLADYRPDSPDVAVAIANFLYDQGRGKDALPLLMNLHSRAPQFAGLAAAYVLLAKISVESRNDVATAQKALAFVRAKFPNDPAAAEAERFGEVIARLPAAPAK